MAMTSFLELECKQMASEQIAAYVGSYPPRACGIATFTRDVSKAVARGPHGMVPRIAAIDPAGGPLSYPPEACWTIDQGDRRSWREAARRINASPVSVVSLQHEFGIFGRFGADGSFSDFLPDFLDRLEKPVVSTLHTVLPHPRPDFLKAVQTIYRRSAAVVTMVNMASLILEQDYGLDPVKLHTIPHGVPHIPRSDTGTMKAELGFEGRTVISTFGLLSRGKGIQYAIQALPEVVSAHPEVLYLIIGETHSEVRKHEGESYRESLEGLVRELGLERHVLFVNHYLPQDRLVRFLEATDIYITPYVERNQITSGTLAYALGAGKAVISTPYLYAAEALAEGRGLLAEFQDPSSFSRCMRMLLEHPGLRAHCQRNARTYGRSMSWATVGGRYADLFRAVVEPALSLPVANLPVAAASLNAVQRQPIASARP